MSKMKTITAIFDTRIASENALHRLERAGFTKDQVTLLISEEKRGRHFGIKENTKSEETALAGAAIGGLIGALIGLGVPEHEAIIYEDSIRKGAILIAVESQDEMSTERITNILKSSDAQSVTAIAA